MINNIILIDDDPEFRKLFVNEAAPKKINVAARSSLEGLKSLVPKSAHNYAAVVLDIKCVLDDSQAKEDASFIGAALKYLDSTLPGFPRFILTGDESEFVGVKKYHVDEKVFLKTPQDKEALFKELEYCVINAEPLRLRRENPELFEAFDKNLITSSKVTVMLSLLSSLNEKDPLKFKGILADIRELHEEIYKCLNQRNKSVVPNKFTTGNGSPSFKMDFYKHLKGNPVKVTNTNIFKATTTVYQDSTIQGISMFIQNSCSEYLHNTSAIKYKINTYTVNALINGLIEVILWSTKY